MSAHCRSAAEPGRSELCRSLGFALLPLLLAACGDRHPALAPVVATVVVTPAAPLLRTIGDSVRLSAAARDAGGAAIAGKLFAWSSSDTGVARVSASGLVTAVAGGSASISATADGISGTAQVTIDPAIVSVAVTPDAPGLNWIGATFPLVAVARDAGGTAITGAAFLWASSDTLVAVVSAAGVVTARRRGTAMISATAGGVSDTVRVTVERIVTRIVIVPATFALRAVGDTVRLVAFARDSGGTAIDDKAFAWSSSDDGVATVTQGGLVTARGLGTATIRVELDAAFSRVGLSVGPSAPLRLQTSITTFQSHSCGLAVGGSAYCWGYNATSALGDSTTVARLTPTAVVGGRAFGQIVGGLYHTCALTPAGAAFCWGDLPADGSSAVPAAVPGGLAFSRIAAGWFHNCGLTVSGAAYCWGKNYSGVLGDGTQENRLVPALVLGGLVFRQLDGAYLHTCGVADTGAAYCWGVNRDGELGDGTTAQRNAPAPVVGGYSFAQIGAGKSHNCALTPDGVAYCWGGTNDAGQIGDGSTGLRRTPVPVVGGLRFVQISVKCDHACGLTASGAAFCWGGNAHGQLGDGTTTDRWVPTPVSGDLSFDQISAGLFHTCGITTSGAAYCWGNNWSGQLGDGTTTGRLVPTAVVGGLTFQVSQRP